jgi:hypothetical protein
MKIDKLIDRARTLCSQSRKRGEIHPTAIDALAYLLAAKEAAEAGDNASATYCKFMAEDLLEFAQ